VALAVGCAGLLAEPASAVTLNLATLAEQTDVYPVSFAGWDAMAIGDCLEGLVADDPSGNAIPGQAKSWTVSPDGLVYTFTLRDDIKWSDGAPVTARDFVTSFQWLFDPANAIEYASVQFPIRNAEAIAKGTLADAGQLGVSAVDDHTLKITLVQPTPYFLQTLTHYSAYPIPTELFEQLGEKWLAPDHIVCNGPYTIVERVPGAYVRSIASDTYYERGQLGVDEVYYYSVGELQAGLDRYKSGQIDAFLDVPHEAIKWIAANVPDQSHVVPFLGVYYYALNEDKPPFDNPDVRRALTLAIDRDAIDPFGLKSQHLSAYGLVPPGTANYDGVTPLRPDWADWPQERRADEARNILAKLGYTAENPLKLQIRYSEISDNRHQWVAAAIADMWAKINVKSELFTAEALDHFDAMRSGDFDVGRVTWLLDVSDPADVLDLMRTKAEGNFSGYSNPTFDALLDKAKREPDLIVRAGILAQAEKLAIDDVAAIPIYWFSAQNIISPAVQGVIDNPKNVHRARWIQKRQ
jgi:oligopeptide transport system substrate-binding protein